MSVFGFFYYILVCALAAGTPGPGTMLVLSSGLRFGFQRTIPAIFGIQLGMLTMAALALSGVTALAQFTLIFHIVEWAGVAYIVYLGLSAIRHRGENTGLDLRSDGISSANWLFWRGALITFSSPKTLLFYVSIFPVFLGDQSERSWLLVVLASALLITTLIIHLIYAYSISFARELLAYHASSVDVTVGVLFLGMAIYMALHI